MRVLHLFQDEPTTSQSSVCNPTGSINSPTTVRNRKVKPVAPDDKLFVGCIGQMEEFIKVINQVRVCSTPGCEGKLSITKSITKGLGGSLKLTFACNVCKVTCQFDSSKPRTGVKLRGSKIVLALQVAAVLSGCHYTVSWVLCLISTWWCWWWLFICKYSGSYAIRLPQTLFGIVMPPTEKIHGHKLNFGLDAVTPPTFSETIKIMHPVVQTLLNEQCEEARAMMRIMKPEDLGSWTK